MARWRVIHGHYFTHMLYTLFVLRCVTCDSDTLKTQASAGHLLLVCSRIEYKSAKEIASTLKSRKTRPLFFAIFFFILLGCGRDTKTG